MDYKKLVESLKYYGTTYAVGDSLGREISGTDELMLNAAEAITDRLAENQALRNAANGFKNQVDAAEARAEKAERERDAAVSDLLRAEEAAEETNVLLDVEVHPACDYSLYLAVHDSVSDIVNWEHDDVWRGHKEELDATSRTTEGVMNNAAHT